MPTQMPWTCTSCAGSSAVVRARPDERNIYVWKASANVGHKSSKQINGMPDQMCSTFVKITKLNQEERFMCLLLIQSFPRYFLSIPPKLNPAQTAAIFVSTQHQPNALESHWQFHVAWHGALLRGTSRCSLPVLLHSQAQGCAATLLGARVCASPGTCRDPSSGARLATASHTTLKSLPPPWIPAREKYWDHFSSHENGPVIAASVCARGGKPFQISFWGTCETTGISSALLNRLDSMW